MIPFFIQMKWKDNMRSYVEKENYVIYVEKIIILRILYVYYYLPTSFLFRVAILKGEKKPLMLTAETVNRCLFASQCPFFSVNLYI